MARGVLSFVAAASVLFLLGSGPAEPADPAARQAAPSCEHDSRTFRCVRYLKNYDGDTITVRIPGVHPLLGEDITVRLKGIDTPEMKGKLACEKDAARDAQAFVAAELAAARRIDLTDVGRDKYFRILAEVSYDGKSLVDELTRRGLGRSYDGGTKSAEGWCTMRGGDRSGRAVTKE